MSGSVRIPISADAGAVIAAFDQIRAAVARAGQDARSFSQIDFSHPELKGLETELRKVQANFEDMMRVSRGATATSIKRGGFNDFLEWYDGRERIYPDPAGQRRHTAVAGTHILRGTQFAPPPPAAPAGAASGAAAGTAGGAHGGGAGGAGGGAASAASMMLGPLKAILALAGVGKVVGMVGQGISQAEDEATQTDLLMRHLRDTSQSFDDLRAAAEQTAEGLQVTYGQMLRLQTTWAKLTNETNNEVLAFRTRYAVQFSRGEGIAPEEGVQALGRASYMGMDEKRFALLVGDAVVAGNQTGQVSQVMQALLQWTETSTRQMVTGDSTREFASYYAAMNASGMPGLKGAAGEQALATMNSTLSQGGGAGLASQVFTWRSLAAQGVTDPYEQRLILSGGMFQTPRGALGHGSDTTVFDAERTEFSREFGSLPMAMQAEMWARQTGLNENVAWHMLSMKPADVDRAGRYMKSIGLDLSSVNPSALGDIAGAVDPSANLDDYRKRLLGRTGAASLSTSEKTTLQGLSGGALRKDIVELLASHGMDHDLAQKTQQATVDGLNALTKVGESLLVPMNDLKSGVAKLVGGVGDLTVALGKLYNYYVHGDKEEGDSAHLLDGTPESQQVLKQMQTSGILVPGWMPAIGSANHGGVPPEAQQKAVMEQSRQYFASQGWGPDKVAGILASEGDESSFNPQANNGTHVGLFQWSQERAALFAKMYGHDILHATVGEQLEFAQWELTHTEKSAGDALKRAHGSYTSGFVFSMDYERAPGGVGTAQYRGEQAAQYDTPLPPATPPSPAAPQVHHTATLHVIHQTQTGHVIAKEHLPMTTVPTPAPWGSGRSPPSHFTEPVQPSDGIPKSEWGTNVYQFAPEAGWKDNIGV